MYVGMYNYNTIQSVTADGVEDCGSIFPGRIVSKITPLGQLRSKEKSAWEQGYLQF